MRLLLQPQHRITTTSSSSPFKVFWLGTCVLLAFLPSLSPQLLLVKAQDVNTFITLFHTVRREFERREAKTILRLAFHDAMGGVDGRIDKSSSEHNGLHGVFDTIEDLFNNNQNLGLGRSDFFAWTYIAAFYLAVPGTDLPWVPLTFGRPDVGDGASEDVPPGGEFGSPDHSLVLDYFQNHFDFNTRDTAIILGAHTMGGAESSNSGFTGDWTRSPIDFNAEYYETMVNPPGREGRWEQVQVGNDKFEWRWGCREDGGCRDLMLNVDMSLFFDITYDSTGKAVLPSGSSCSSNRIFDDCFPSQTSGTEDVVNDFRGGQSTSFRSAFANVYGRMLKRIKTSSTLSEIGQPDDWPNLDQSGGSDDDDGDPDIESCFSKFATIQVEHKGVVQMQHLQVGDRIWTGTKFELVYAFGHHHDKRVGKFLTIQTADTNTQKPLEMTENHLVFREVNGNAKAVAAGELKVGDIVQLSSLEGPRRSTAVTKISSVTREGLYMPLTPSGTIVVDGILASTYVSLQKMAPTVADDSKLFPFVSDDNISHWWMSPYRMMCLGISSTLCKDPVRDEEGILWWLLAGKRFAEFADQQGFPVRVFIIGVPTFLVFGLLNTAEVLLGGPSLAPVVLLAMVCVLSWSARKQKREGKTKSH